MIYGSCVSNNCLFFRWEKLEDENRGKKRYTKFSMYDIIVVPGAAVLKGGKPSPPLKRRAEHAIFLFKEGRGGDLLFSGGVGNNPPAEALVMKKIALEKDIPEKHIYVETESKNTFDSVENCVRIIKRNGWQKVLVVSDTYHVPRVRFVFRFFGITADGAPAGGGKQANTLFRWTFYHIREMAAFLWYALRMIRFVWKRRR